MRVVAGLLGRQGGSRITESFWRELRLHTGTSPVKLAHEGDSFLYALSIPRYLHGGMVTSPTKPVSQRLEMVLTGGEGVEGSNPAIPTGSLEMQDSRVIRE